MALSNVTTVMMFLSILPASKVMVSARCKKAQPLPVEWVVRGYLSQLGPIVPDGYTYWDYKQLRFPRNEGLRIDFILGSHAFAEAYLRNREETAQSGLDQQIADRLHGALPEHDTLTLGRELRDAR